MSFILGLLENGKSMIFYSKETHVTR
uniref:Uncharacterized protein n=1 Tax=Rhizophora mucronata TaxID=61149 RepID=A0A2P2R4K3_RHIMU